MKRYEGAVSGLNRQRALRACIATLRTRKVKLLLIRLAAVVFLVPVLLQCLLAYSVARDARILPPQLQSCKNLLVVTAHPDDESLFFSPSIIGVLDGNHAIRGSLLAMSRGMS